MISVSVVSAIAAIAIFRFVESELRELVLPMISVTPVFKTPKGDLKSKQVFGLAVHNWMYFPVVHHGLLETTPRVLRKSLVSDFPSTVKIRYSRAPSAGT